jgi:hypothetical protein
MSREGKQKEKSADTPNGDISADVREKTRTQEEAR